MNSTGLQGTKVLEDREIRFHCCSVSEDVPPQHISPKIVKYTGTLVAPEWRDIEPGRVFSFSRHSMKSTQSRKDKFETLCRIKADLSTAPHTSKLNATGKTGYERCYDIIMLVGLTELKAQVSWIDSVTVRAHTAFRVSIYLTRLPCT